MSGASGVGAAATTRCSSGSRRLRRSRRSSRRPRPGQARLVDRRGAGRHRQDAAADRGAAARARGGAARAERARRRARARVRVRRRPPALRAGAREPGRARAAARGRGGAGRDAVRAGRRREAASEADSSFAVLHGLYWLTVNLSAEQPLLLAIDDLHWCDRPSLRFLAFLVRRLEGLPVLAVASLRTNEPGVDAALLVELLGDPLAVPLHPRPLSETAVAELVRGRLGDQADPAFAESCHAATGGNPLLLNELLKALETEGVQPVASHVATVRELGPRAASRAVLVRLARLHADAVAVARGDRGARRRRRPRRGRGARRGRPARRPRRRPGSSRGPRSCGPSRRSASCIRSSPAPSTATSRRASASCSTSAPRSCSTRRARPPEQVAAHLLAIPARGEEWVVTTLRRAAGQAMHKGAPESAVAYLTRALAEPPLAEQEGAPAARARRRGGAHVRAGGDRSTSAWPTSASTTRPARDRGAAPRARAALHRQAGRERRRRAGRGRGPAGGARRPAPRVRGGRARDRALRHRRARGAAHRASGRRRRGPRREDARRGRRDRARVLGRAGGRVRRPSRCGRSRAAT